ncbi:MAG TPA: phospholipase D-like domain-containing protein [Anaerolineae bacterium]|nr:phospholipase D-like domain-containing protein [Anaerolineae bacterium]
MKVRAAKDGLTVQAIAGTYTVILGFDLEESKRAGCLGFSIQRTELDSTGAPLEELWLANRLRFPSDAAGADTSSQAELPGPAARGGAAAEPVEMMVDFRPPEPVEVKAPPNTTDRSPWQSFRYVDSKVEPGRTYRYRVIAQYGRWNQLKPGAKVRVEVKMEDPKSPATAVFFNRAAASSQTYIEKFGDNDPSELPAPKQNEAYAWLSRGLEEAILAFLARAKDSRYALHAAIYEFEKPELLQSLHAAIQRGAEVKVVYHYDEEKTGKDNEQAARHAGLDAVCAQRKNQGQISHNKFVVLLKNGAPRAVWTGSTNWTDGGIYGQLNVGQAITDPKVAATYENYFNLLYADTPVRELKQALAVETDVSVIGQKLRDGPGIWAIFSPQKNSDMLDLYADICRNAKCLLVCAPFELAPQIREVLVPASQKPPKGTLRFILIDKSRSLGENQDVTVIDRKPGNEVSLAVTLRSPLHDFQNRLLAGKESFHHQGVHIHAKLIIADPFGGDPVLVIGSANYSNNSTVNNDENTLIMRGKQYAAVADIYATEFFRMFDSYYFRGKILSQPQDRPITLAEDDSWTVRYYEPDSSGDDDKMLSRQLFAGTLRGL